MTDLITESSDKELWDILEARRLADGAKHLTNPGWVVYDKHYKQYVLVDGSNAYIPFTDKELIESESS